MGVVSVGPVNVTPEFLEFNNSYSLDGTLGTTQAERAAYVRALEAYSQQIEATAEAEGRELTPTESALVRRLGLYIDMIDHDCASRNLAIPLVQGLYEDLVALVEEPAPEGSTSNWDRLDSPTRTRIVGLIAESYLRLDDYLSLEGRAGQHRLPPGVRVPRAAGNATEALPRHDNPPTQPFQPHPAVIDQVMLQESEDDAVRAINVRSGACSPGDNMLPNVYPLMPRDSDPNTPAPDRVSFDTNGDGGWARYRVNLDSRFGLRDVPQAAVRAQQVIEAREAQEPAAAEGQAEESSGIELSVGVDDFF